MSDIKASELIIGADTYEGAFEEEDESAESGCDSNDETADADHFSLYSVPSADDDNMLSKMEDPPCNVQPMDIK